LASLMCFMIVRYIRCEVNHAAIISISQTTISQQIPVWLLTFENLDKIYKKISFPKREVLK
jgi:hypothetical protein